MILPDFKRQTNDNDDGARDRPSAAAPTARQMCLRRRLLSGRPRLVPWPSASDFVGAHGAKPTNR